jgi:hypothetical protein
MDNPWNTTLVYKASYAYLVTIKVHTSYILEQGVPAMTLHNISVLEELLWWAGFGVTLNLFFNRFRSGVNVMMSIYVR